MKSLQPSERRGVSRSRPIEDRVLTIEITTPAGTVHEALGIVYDESEEGLGVVMRHHPFIQPNVQVRAREPRSRWMYGRIIWIQGCDTVTARIGLSLLK